MGEVSKTRRVVGSVVGVGVVAFLWNAAGFSAPEIVSYPMLLQSYRVGDVSVLEDTAPFPATPLFTQLAGQQLGNWFVQKDVKFGGEGEALKELCSVAHPTATCSAGELETSVAVIAGAAASRNETIPVDYRLRFKGGFTGNAYSALVRVTFQRVR